MGLRNECSLLGLGDLEGDFWVVGVDKTDLSLIVCDGDAEVVIFQ